MALADLATEVARREYDAPVTEVSSDAIKSVSISLVHIHIPKLADAEVIHYDSDQHLVSLDQQADQIEQYPPSLAVGRG